MNNLICDLHIHSALKAFANQGADDRPDDIWTPYPERSDALDKLNPMLRAAIKDIAKASQAHLDACVAAQLLAPVLSIYPVERQMFDFDPRKPFRRIFQLLLGGDQSKYLGAAVSGFPVEKVEHIMAAFSSGRDEGVDYFAQYLEECRYLIRQTDVPSAQTGFRFRIAANYEERRAMLADGQTVAGMITAEGAHAFGHYLRNSTLKKRYEELEGTEKEILEISFRQNIQRVKTEDDGRLAPFFVTFCHHFNNLLAGHARSLSDRSNLLGNIPWPNRPGMRYLFNQETHLNDGFTPLGQAVLDLFLDRKQGRRILIDTKHMSINSRREFYRYVREKREKENDRIPIIHSHGAVSGWPTLEEAQRHVEDEGLDKDRFFSAWQINLTDEDILETYDSDGIIGVLLHESRMPGEGFKEEMHQLKKKRARTRRPDKAAALDQRINDMYMQLLWSNIFQIVKTVRDHRSAADGWKVIALGSDYDGLVNPFDSFADVSAFQSLRTSMVRYLRERKDIVIAESGRTRRLSTEEISTLLAGRSAAEAVGAILWDNLDGFLAKYFTEEYLAREVAAAA